MPPCSRTTPIVAAAALALAACGAGPFSPDESRALQQAEARWAATGPSHYTIEMRRLCFCPAEIIDWATVEVRNDSVIATTLLGGGPVPELYWNQRPPVTALFAQLHAPAPDWVRDISARYDPATGYPASIQLTSDNSVADADWTVEARNLIPLD